MECPAGSRIGIFGVERGDRWETPDYDLVYVKSAIHPMHVRFKGNGGSQVRTNVVICIKLVFPRQLWSAP